MNATYQIQTRRTNVVFGFKKGEERKGEKKGEGGEMMRGEECKNWLLLSSFTLNLKGKEISYFIFEQIYPLSLMLILLINRKIIKLGINLI